MIIFCLKFSPSPFWLTSRSLLQASQDKLRLSLFNTAFFDNGPYFFASPKSLSWLKVVPHHILQGVPFAPLLSKRSIYLLPFLEQHFPVTVAQ